MRANLIEFLLELDADALYAFFLIGLLGGAGFVLSLALAVWILR